MFIAYTVVAVSDKRVRHGGSGYETSVQLRVRATLQLHTYGTKMGLVDFYFITYDISSEILTLSGSYF